MNNAQIQRIKSGHGKPLGELKNVNFIVLYLKTSPAQTAKMGLLMIVTGIESSLTYIQMTFSNIWKEWYVGNGQHS